MVETALFGLAKSVLGALGSPAVDEFKLLWGQEEQLEGLRNTVDTVQAILHDAEQREVNEAPVRSWLARLSAVLYDADDLFDKIVYNDLHEKAKAGSKIGKKVRRVFLKPRCFAFTVKTAHKVKGIRERLDAIASDIRGFGFLIQIEQYPAHRFHIEREKTHSYVPINEVVGRDQEREDLVNMLLSGCSNEHEEGVSIIAVIGIGGLGKTTLSQLVYNDGRVQGCFDICIWACINYFSPLEQVLTSLVEIVTKRKVEVQNVETMKNKLIEELKGKRFLLVLDDVWDENPQNWHKLKILLDAGKLGSMVLATTRSVKVAQSLCAIEPYYYLQCISDESAWLLFKKIALGGKQVHHRSRLEGLGQLIVKKCANVPLVIVTIASCLKYQEEKKWLSLIDDEFPIVAHGDHMKVLQALRFSYTEFPYPVKCCFSFCSLFPKDHRFEKDSLTRLWLAEGFFDSYDMAQSLEDKANDCFFYLVDRCFFQNIKTHEENHITKYTFQMHDLVHDLAKEVAGSESVLVHQNDAGKTWNTTTRHVLLVDHFCFSPHSKRLRTFIHLNGEHVGRSDLSKLMSSFKVLRALDLSSLGIERIPSSIGTLFHLRFLDLSDNFMKELPSSICNLYHLRSLILQECRFLENLPIGIGKLLSLRHLMLDGCENLSLIPQGLTTLTSLVTLDILVTHEPSVELQYLECLDNLSGSLEIVIHGKRWKTMTIDTQRSYLSRKTELHALTIGFSNMEIKGDVDILIKDLAPHPNLEYLNIYQFSMSKMPIWVMCLDRLVILKLRGCNELVELPPLSRLPSLKDLFIEDMCSMLSIEGNCMLDDVGLMFYPSLETLQIEDTPELRGWWEIEPMVRPRFPRVTNVVIRGCSKMRVSCMPLFPLEIVCLQLMNVQEGIMCQGIGSEIGSSFGVNNTSALKTLYLFRVSGLRSIEEAQIRHLCALQNLHIEYCSELENVSLRGLAYLTSLVELRIERCGKVRWGVDMDEEGEKIEVTWENLTRLATLVIPYVNRSCFNLLKYLTSLQELHIYNYFDEDLQSMLLTTNIIEEEEEDGMPWKPLRKLRKLQLAFGYGFSNQGNRQLLSGVKYLTNSLQDLILRDCKELYFSWRGVLSLNHLEYLDIRDVERVIDVDDSDQVKQRDNPTSPLRDLRIYGGSREWVVGIPWKSFLCLRSLDVRDKGNIEIVPEGIQHLDSLKTLTIGDFVRVVSLPNWITSLSSLCRLNIWGCSEELQKRCKRLIGEDWPLIKHIQDIDITIA